VPAGTFRQYCACTGPTGCHPRRHERVHIVLQRLARVERAVVVGRREPGRPLGPPVDEIPAGFVSTPIAPLPRLPPVVDEVLVSELTVPVRRLAGAQKKCLGFVAVEEAAAKRPGLPRTTVRRAAVTRCAASARADRWICTPQWISGLSPAGRCVPPRASSVRRFGRRRSRLRPPHTCR